MDERQEEGQPGNSRAVGDCQGLAVRDGVGLGAHGDLGGLGAIGGVDVGGHGGGDPGGRARGGSIPVVVLAP